MDDKNQKSFIHLRLTQIVNNLELCETTIIGSGVTCNGQQQIRTNDKNTQKRKKHSFINLRLADHRRQILFFFFFSLTMIRTAFINVIYYSFIWPGNGNLDEEGQEKVILFFIHPSGLTLEKVIFYRQMINLNEQGIFIFFGFHDQFILIDRKV